MAEYVGQPTVIAEVASSGECGFSLVCSFIENAIGCISSVAAISCGLTLAFLGLGILCYPRLSSPSGRIVGGLDQVWPPRTCAEQKHPTIDIVAIHRLDTWAPKTWVAYRNRRNSSNGEINWLKDDNMLPQKLRDARIFTYDWNANTIGDPAEDTLLGHAKTLIRELGERDCNDTPMIFIASCFGGLLLAKAITHASIRFSDEYDVIKNTRGMIFLGTPFSGSDTAKAAEVRARLARAMRSESSDSLIRYVKNPRINLEETVEDFTRLAKDRKIPLTCFYETRTSIVLNGLFPNRIVFLIPDWLKPWIPFAKPRILVPKNSASLHTFPSLPLQVKHSLLNKFFGPDDANFKQICVELESLKAMRTDNLRQALRSFYSGSRLDIDRLSGEKLDMDRCFINLGIVHYRNDSHHRVYNDNSDKDPDAALTFEARLKVQIPPRERQLMMLGTVFWRKGLD
ncbi:hypothetical protein EV356DRAFT_575695 [Viridothelium virens]|uniref:DUF676 domain-containing protein n=1 Tax=Viridothelium virens TaxID=1048519 RepID=A0A6A6HBT1_VIRVR|nr:hypothetical protein EV356DRAFT_575695 [Viridothelium virens]